MADERNVSKVHRAGKDEASFVIIVFGKAVVIGHISTGARLGKSSQEEDRRRRYILILLRQRVQITSFQFLLDSFFIQSQ